MTEFGRLHDESAVGGANVHDVRLLEKTFDSFVIFRLLAGSENPQNLCLEAGYTGHGESAGKRGYMPHIRHRSEEKKEIENNRNFKAHRWVVEVSHSFVNQFRKLLVRFEKTDNSYFGLLEFAVIVWRKLIPVHGYVCVLLDRVQTGKESAFSSRKFPP